MAETKPVEAPKATVASPRNSSAREVLAARLKNAQDRGILTPKLQRQFDRMAANVVKGQ